ncbi:MAG: triose-phosphate isomerase [Patescibacteria group bacterium]
MTKKIIIANWKANPDSAGRAVKIAREISAGISGARNVEVVIAPSTIHISNLKFLTSNFQLGAQDSFWEDTGPYTGEISWHQLKHCGVQYVILGHSERRALCETNEKINKKIKAVLESGMKAVLCVGELEKQRDVAFPRIIHEELKEGLKGVKKILLKNLIVVYEPVWAISSNKNSKPDSPKNVFEMSVLIRRELLKMFGKKIAFSIRIIYGGSVDEKNAADFVRLGRVDGLLVGAASLNSKKFIEIIKKVSRV